MTIILLTYSPGILVTIPDFSLRVSYEIKYLVLAKAASHLPEPVAFAANNIS
jgi:hypothetical protein